MRPLELLAESGYDQLTIDAVAERARCSKATIYRRWPGKAALVITAVRRHAGQPVTAAPGTTGPGTTRPETTAPDTGSLRSDLLAALQAMRSSLSGQDAALILGLLTAMHRDPELAGTVREQVLQAKREVFGAVIARAAARGDVPVLSANGYPHFTRGITKRRYPCSLGNGPVPNFVAGWAALVVGPGPRSKPP